MAVISDHHLVHEECRRRGVKSYYVDELTGDPLALRARAHDHSRRWYLRQGLGQYGPYQLGDFWLSFYEEFYQALRRVEALAAAVGRWRPAEVMVQGSWVQTARLELGDSVRVRRLATLGAEPGPVWGRVLRPGFLGIAWRWSAMEFFTRGRSRLRPDVPVLAVVSHINHTRTLIPVLRALRADGIACDVLAVGAESRAELARAGLAYSGLGDHPGPSADRWRQLFAEFGHRARLLRSLRPETPGFDPYRHLTGFLAAQVRWEFPRRAALVDWFESRFASADYRLVLVAEDQAPEEYAAIVAGRRYGVGSVYVQHGVFGDVQQAKNVSADVVAVWGEDSVRRLREHAQPHTRFIVTGNPRAGLPQRRGRPPAPPHIVWTPAVPTGRRDVLLESVNARIFAALQELAERRPSWSFTVKLHPYALHRQFHPRRRLANLRVLQSEPLGPVLEAASVVVAWNTTVVLEAVAMDRPLVGPSLGLLPEFVPAATLGVAIEVRAIGEFEPAIEAALRLDGCPNREAYLAKVMPYGADEAAGRVLAVIKGELGM